MFFRVPEWKYLRYEISYRWGRLDVRKWIDQHPKIIIGIIIACVSLMLLIIVYQIRPVKILRFAEEEKAWFYDLNTGKLFVAKSDKVPPIKAPSGPLANGQPAGVRAYVFSYEDESDESTRFIGFLEIVDPNAKKGEAGSIESGASAGVESIKQWGKGRLIRRVDDEQWVLANSKEGIAILEKVFLPNKNGAYTRYISPE